MNDQTRKASDILLDLESKVDTLRKEQQSLALSINVLSNRLSGVIDLLNTLSSTVDTNADVMVSSSSKSIPVSNENTIPIEDFSKRDNYIRTQRQETFASTPTITTTKEQPKVSNIGGKVSVSQRVVDGTGKAILLANVEITNKTTTTVAHKGRTDGVGKFHASLSPGEYLVRITKAEAMNKAKIDVSQNLLVDGNQGVLNLPVMIIK